jgi:hypothetical protein
MQRSGWISWSQQEAKPVIFWRRLSCERAARIGNPKGPGSGALELSLGRPVGRSQPPPAQGWLPPGPFQKHLVVGIAHAVGAGGDGSGRAFAPGQEVLIPSNLVAVGIAPPRK